MSAGMAFDGVAFDPTASDPTASDPTASDPTGSDPTAGTRDPAPSPPPAPVPASVAAPVPAGDGPAAAVARIRHTLVAAHHSALAAHEALQRHALVADRPQPAPADDLPPAPTGEAAFRSLTRNRPTALDRGALDRLVAGDLVGALGTEHDQHGANPDLCAPHAGRLEAVTGLVAPGEGRHGDLRARVRDGASAAEAALGAAEVLALALGLHLSLPDTTLVGAAPDPTGAGAGDGDLRLDVLAVDLVPRPHLRARAVLERDGAVAARLGEVTVEVRERPGSALGPDADGRAPFLGRVCPDGEPALLGEFQLAHIARGDLAVGMGEPFARFADRVATRLPSHGLLLVDRVVDVRGTRGVLDHATWTTEYDSPADAWYRRESGNADVPNAVLMETSLQAGLLGGYYLGATLVDPDQDHSLRNLSGHGTLLADLDPAGRTVRQHSTLVSTTPMPGSILQEFSYTLSVDGEPYYEGASMFGYFSASALANQTGLDGGRDAPTWLDEQPTAPPARTLDLAVRRRAGTGPVAPPRDHFALLDTVTVVDGGGRHGAGYLHAERRVDPGDWFFARHFHRDPVVPGSLGVEQILQAMQEWALDAGLADDLDAPELVVPVGTTLSWRYRGQVLPTDGVTVLEVHLSGVERRPGRVRVTSDASLWKPGLRIYEVLGATVELRTPGAPPW